MWPMEFIKTQLQLQEKLKAGEKPKFTGMIGGACLSCLSVCMPCMYAYGPPTLTPCTRHSTGLRYTVREQGFLALYRGLAPTLISSFPKAGIRFSTNAYLKKMLMDEQGKLTPGTKKYVCVRVPTGSAASICGGSIDRLIGRCLPVLSYFADT